MPISLRLPADIEAQITNYGARQGLTKSSVIVRSIQEFLTRHAQPSSLDIYEQAMQDALSQPTPQVNDAGFELATQRPFKTQVRDALRRKHAERSARATKALAMKTTTTSAIKSA